MKFPVLVLSINVFFQLPIHYLSTTLELTGLNSVSGCLENGIYWEYNNHTLIISGEGNLFYIGEAPWNLFQNQIQTLIVEGEILSLGYYPESPALQDYIGYTFAGYSALTTVVLPESLQYLGKGSFQGCDSLSEIVLPDGLQLLGDGCFGGCDSLVSIQIPESIKSLNKGCFLGCESLEQVILPDGLISIGDSCFSGCHRLTQIALPNHLQTLESWCFLGCDSLTEIILPKALISLGNGCFAECSELLSVSLPHSMTVLPEKCFMNCTKLTSVTIPDNVRIVYADCFSGCVSLTDMQLPDTMTYLGKNALKDTPYLASLGDFVIYGDGILYAYQGNARLLKIPTGIQKICDEVFWGNNNLLSVTIPEGFTAIPRNCFANCRNLKEMIVLSADTIIEPQENFAVTDIYGVLGSAAEQFAQENGITFHDVAELDDQPNHGTDMTLDFTADIWTFGNSHDIFGSGYYLTDADRQHLVDLGFNPKDADASWSGSCLGLAVTVILAKNGIFSPSQLQSGAQSLSEIEPTEAVQSFVNYFQNIQGSDGTSQGYEPRSQQFYRMLKIAKNIPNGESPFLLTFATQTGSHAVVGYGQESGSWEYGGRTYDGRILIWDSNFPNSLHDESCLYYDSETFAYCIPCYNVYMAEGDTRGGIIMVCNDLDVLNAYPYLFRYEQGDINTDGVVEIADAVLLARVIAEDDRVTQINWDVADVDADGLITIMDVMKLLNILVS